MLVTGISRGLAEALQKIREHWMRVQWYVAKDVVKDVRLRDVIERSSRTDRHRRREAPPRERLKEKLRLEEALHRHRPPAGLRF